MSAVRKTLTSVVSAALLAGGLLVATAGPASADGCGDRQDPKIDGAVASWTLTCGKGAMTMKGWVEDTRADGKCAVVRISSGNAYQAPKACGSGTRTPFTYTFKGQTTAQGRLALV
ncbi:hypothetical protein [Streptomyces laurentii]|uniref:hypothetical protein n=1 Tax=Streptomyces laurentii TaxID=39478 RepID=UPI0036C7B690